MHIVYWLSQERFRLPCHLLNLHLKGHFMIKSDSDCILCWKYSRVSFPKDRNLPHLGSPLSTVVPLYKIRVAN